MTTARTHIQHAGGTHFSLKTLYDLARSEEKEARHLVDKEFAQDSAFANAKDATTMMSSITDSDGYTTVSRHGGSPTTSPLRPRLQPEGKEGNRKNPFDNRFLTTFLPFFANSPAKMHVPVNAVPPMIMGIAPSGMRKKNNFVGGTETAQVEDLEEKTYAEPGQRGSSANFLLALSTKESDGHVRVEKEKKAKKITPSYDKYLSLSLSLKGVGTMAIMEVDEERKIYDEPGQHGSSAEFLPALLDKGSGGHENNNTSSHDKYASPSLSLKTLAGIKLDLDAYINDPASCQPSKKALCADQMSLVTAAQASSSSASPKCISIYNNKWTAFLSPTKGGISSQNTPRGGGQQ